MGRKCVGTIESYPDPDNCEDEDGDGRISAIDACWKLHCQSGICGLERRENGMVKRWVSMLDSYFRAGRGLEARKWWRQKWSSLSSPDFQGKKVAPGLAGPSCSPVRELYTSEAVEAIFYRLSHGLNLNSLPLLIWMC